jgi:hypothetical protein
MAGTATLGRGLARLVRCCVLAKHFKIRSVYFARAANTDKASKELDWVHQKE